MFDQPQTPPSPLMQFLQATPLLGVPNWILLSLGLLMAVLLLLITLGKVPKSYNLLNIRVRWKTTTLTALAFTLVISLLVVMLAFVNGMKALTEASGQPGNVLVLSQGSTDETFSDLGFSDLGDIENQPGIERENDRPLVSRELYLVVNQPIPYPVPGRPKRRFLQLRGLDDPAQTGRVHGLELHPGGEWFAEAGVREQSEGSGPPFVECVVGEGIARVLAVGEKKEIGDQPAALTVGDTFTLNDRQWLITGVLKSAGSTFDSEVWAKRSLIGPMFGKPSYTTLVCRTANAAAADKLARHFRENYSKATLSSFTEAKYFEKLNEYNRVLLIAITFVTVILAVGGVFGVMNTMFAAISQRTKDIGVLRLMGYGRRHIVASFLLEAMVIGLIGGLIGCALGALCDGWSATSILNGGGGSKTVVLHLTVDTAVLAAGLLLTLLMALIGGLLPALNAMRLTALEALR
jgi:putative ABC transport system permease protein